MDELSRRQFMVNAARSYLGVSVAPMLGASLATQVSAQNIRPGAKAKSVIFLNMAGGMSHIDTFDVKPKSKSIQGPTEVVDTNVPGIQIAKNLEKTGQVMDKLCVINSMTSTQGAHEQGQYQLHKNYAPRGTIVHPSLGSWVLKLGGRINESIPGYVAVRSNAGSVSGGFFGANYSAVPIGQATEGLKNSLRHGSVSEADFDARLSLASKLNAEFHSQYNQKQVKAYDGLYQEAVKLMKSEDLKAFDITQEPSEVKAAYGEGQFNQGCLLARRLVQHGVRFVEVTLEGWDTHYDNFNEVRNRCQILDQAYATLIQDLEKNGLLDSTVVALGTEFGRTPEIKEDHNMGRDHHPQAFTCVLAGGGIKGGQLYGSTDRRGKKVAEKPVTHQNFSATIGHALGLDLNKTVYSPSKRPFWIADKAEPISEIF